jgi:photosystem II stability/assembly factor-like uncharacterized protein
MKKICLLFSIAILSINSIKAQWTQTNSGITDLNQGAKILASSDTYLFSGANAKMYRSNTNGDSWSEIQPPITGNVPECGYFFNGKYFAGMNASTSCIYYSSDHGSNWNSTNGAPTASVVRGFIDLSTNLFAYTSNLGVYKSTDGGLNWSSSNTGLSNLNVIDMESINNKLIATTIGGGVFISTDNGDNWVQSNTGIGSGELNGTLTWRMGTNLYYVEQGGASYTSTNEGANWTTWTKPQVMGISPLEVHRKGSSIYIETRHFDLTVFQLKDSVYMSQNEGNSWTNITSDLPNNLNGSGLYEFNSFVYIAFNSSSAGLGIYRNAISTAIENITMNNTIALYPNPFQHQLNLNNQVLSIRVYNMIGKEVMYLTHPNQTFNTSHLDNGIYIFEIELTDKSKQLQKCIKN